MSKDGERVNEITFSAVWRSVPPSSITRPESAKGAVPHAVMSSVPPEWMITGTGCEEIARSGYRVEAVEFKITEDSPITEVHLKDLKIKKNVLIASINRKGKIIIPSGRDRIHVGDSVMIVSINLGYDNIAQILA